MPSSSLSTPHPRSDFLRHLAAVALTLAIAIPTTWYFARRPDAAPKPAGRAVLYYQSAMHPWITSDKPGRCTICGMDLTPVYEGAVPAADADIVTLSDSTIRVMNVATEAVAPRPLTRGLHVAGIVDNDRTRHRVLSAYVDGRIDKLMVNYTGALVVAGQPLAHLYSPALLTARDEYLLLARQAGPQDRLLAAAREKLIRLGLTPEQIAALPGQPATRDYIEIVAPIGGTVISQNVYEGQYIKSGDRLFEIGDLSHMWFVFRAYEQDLPWLRIGQQVEVTTPSHPGQIFHGAISFIDPNVEEATRSTSVRVELPNRPVGDEHRLSRRLYADGRVSLDAPEVLAVPRSAVIETGREAVAFVERDHGAYERRVLGLGRRGDHFIEALTGLAAGEKVVTNGNLLIDSQAEMNRALAPAMAAPPTHPTKATELLATPMNAEAAQAVASFTKATDRLAAALAADDLRMAREAAPEAMKAAMRLQNALRDRAGMLAEAKVQDAMAALQTPADLAAARRAFHTFSMATIGILEAVRTSPGGPLFSIWECPMVDSAIEGVPSAGRWIQAPGRPIGNPYFGKEMLECGGLVKP